MLLSACNNLQTKEKEISDFKQFEIALPSEMETPYDLRVMDEGAVYMAGFDKKWEIGTLWMLKDEEWEKIYSFTDVIPLNIEDYEEKEASVFILSETQLLYTLSLIQDNGIRENYHFMLENNKAIRLYIELPIIQDKYTNDILLAKQYNDDSFIIQDLTGNLFLIDNQTGQTIKNILIDDLVHDFAIYDKNLYALTNDGIEVLAIETGIALEPCDAVKFLEESLTIPQPSEPSKFMRQRITVNKDEISNRIFVSYIGDEGLKYSNENETKNLLDKKNTCLADQSASIYKLERYKDKYYVIAFNEEGSHIFKYTNKE